MGAATGLRLFTRVGSLLLGGLCLGALPACTVLSGFDDYTFGDVDAGGSGGQSGDAGSGGDSGTGGGGSGGSGGTGGSGGSSGTGGTGGGGTGGSGGTGGRCRNTCLPERLHAACPRLQASAAQPWGVPIRAA